MISRARARARAEGVRLFAERFSDLSDHFRPFGLPLRPIDFALTLCGWREAARSVPGTRNGYGLDRSLLAAANQRSCRVPLRAVGRRYRDLTIIKVSLQPIDCARIVRQRHIGVRPNQIGSVLGETGGSVLLPPRKYVER